MTTLDAVAVTHATWTLSRVRRIPDVVSVASVTTVNALDDGASTSGAIKYHAVPSRPMTQVVVDAVAPADDHRRFDADAVLGVVDW
jgi:hypothetical protein